MARARVDDAAVRRFQTNPNGPFGKKALREANELRTAALRSEHMAVDEGRLRSSIWAKADALPDGSGMRARTGTDVRYAAAVHNGQRPHWPPISVMNAWVARKRLAVSGFVVARSISRHGTKARPFLTDPLLARHPRARIFARLRR